MSRRRALRFRVYPGRGGRLYFEVRIYPTKTAMYRALGRLDRWLGVREDWDRSEAVCRTFETLRYARRRWQSTPRLGIVYFYWRHLGAGIVAHEMTHGAIHWAARIGLSGRRVWGRSVALHPGGTPHMPPANERFAWAVGSLCAQFWAWVLK